MSSNSGQKELEVSRSQRLIFKIILLGIVPVIAFVAVVIWVWILMKITAYFWSDFSTIHLIGIFFTLSTGILLIVSGIGALIRSHRLYLLTKIVKFTNPNQYTGGLQYLFPSQGYREIFGKELDFFKSIHEDIINSNSQSFNLSSGELGAIITAYSNPDHTKIFDICERMREQGGTVSIITGREEGEDSSLVEIIDRIKKGAESEEGVTDDDIPLLIYDTLDYLTDGTLQVILLSSRPNLHFGIADNRLYIQQRHRQEDEKSVHWYILDPPWYMMLEHRIRLKFYRLYADWRDMMASYTSSRYARINSHTSTNSVRAVIVRLNDDLSKYGPEERMRLIGSAFCDQEVLNTISKTTDEEQIYEAAIETIDIERYIKQDN